MPCGNSGGFLLCRDPLLLGGGLTLGLESCLLPLGCECCRAFRFDPLALTLFRGSFLGCNSTALFRCSSSLDLLLLAMLSLLCLPALTLDFLLQAFTGQLFFVPDLFALLRQFRLQ